MTALSEWKPDDVLKAIALVGAACAFIVGLFQYRRAQQWKRAEWVAQQMKELFSDPIVQAVSLMIDWGSRRILLYPAHSDETKRHVWLTDDAIAKALMAHEARPEGFTELEADIRAAFDRFLDGIERFASYEASGLVTIDDLRPYLQYWAINICRQKATDGTEDRLIQLCVYIDKYGFGGAHALLRRIAPEQ
jgi:hypothetical protein